MDAKKKKPPMGARGQPPVPPAQYRPMKGGKPC